jgi:hypothetical protein
MFSAWPDPVAGFHHQRQRRQYGRPRAMSAFDMFLADGEISGDAASASASSSPPDRRTMLTQLSTVLGLVMTGGLSEADAFATLCDGELFRYIRASMHALEAVVRARNAVLSGRDVIGEDMVAPIAAAASAVSMGRVDPPKRPPRGARALPRITVKLSDEQTATLIPTKELVVSLLCRLLPSWTRAAIESIATQQGPIDVNGTAYTLDVAGRTALVRQHFQQAWNLDQDQRSRKRKRQEQKIPASVASREMRAPEPCAPDHPSACALCFSNLRQVTLLPCKHLAMCCACAQTGKMIPVLSSATAASQPCPICRQPVSDYSVSILS